MTVPPPSSTHTYCHRLNDIVILCSSFPDRACPEYAKVVAPTQMAAGDPHARHSSLRKTRMIPAYRLVLLPTEYDESTGREYVCDERDLLSPSALGAGTVTRAELQKRLADTSMPCDQAYGVLGLFYGPTVDGKIAYGQAVAIRHTNDKVLVLVRFRKNDMGFRAPEQLFSLTALPSLEVSETHFLCAPGYDRDVSSVPTLRADLDTEIAKSIEFQSAVTSLGTLTPLAGDDTYLDKDMKSCCHDVVDVLEGSGFNHLADACRVILTMTSVTKPPVDSITRTLNNLHLNESPTNVGPPPMGNQDEHAAPTHYSTHGQTTHAPRCAMVPPMVVDVEPSPVGVDSRTWDRFQAFLESERTSVTQSHLPEKETRCRFRKSDFDPSRNALRAHRILAKDGKGKFGMDMNDVMSGALGAGEYVTGIQDAIKAMFLALLDQVDAREDAAHMARTLFAGNPHALPLDAFKPRTTAPGTNRIGGSDVNWQKDSKSFTGKVPVPCSSLAAFWTRIHKRSLLIRHFYVAQFAVVDQLAIDALQAGLVAADLSTVIENLSAPRKASALACMGNYLNLILEEFVTAATTGGSNALDAAQASAAAFAADTNGANARLQAPINSIVMAGHLAQLTAKAVVAPQQRAVVARVEKENDGNLFGSFSGAIPTGANGLKVCLRAYGGKCPGTCVKFAHPSPRPPLPSDFKNYVMEKYGSYTLTD